MPPPILADSDDDGDDIAVESDTDSPALVPTADHPGDFDGTIEQSTGSTERLRNQIRDAERSLFAPSAKQAVPDAAMSIPMVGSSGSPTVQGRKRRQSAVDELSGPTSSPEKRVKRSKTAITTYSRNQCSAPRATDDETNSTSRNDIAEPRTSQSAKFTEHSDTHSSMALPQASAFVNHEPNVMFRDSGSTIKENESSQRRLVEQALALKKGFATSIAKSASDDDQKSSSFPWSASEQTPSTVKASGATGHTNAPEASAPDPTIVEEVPSERVEIERPNDVEVDLPKSYTSPRVQIAAHSGTTATLETAPSTLPEKPRRGRKCKGHEESSEPLDSDDRAVGLPREKYQPRPSRRRATQMVDEPIDYGVIPEKAVRSRRRKTADAVMADVATVKGANGLNGAASGGRSLSGEQELRDAIQSPIKATSPTPDIRKAEEGPVWSPIGKADQDEIFVKPCPTQSSTTSSTKQVDHDDTFVKPSLKPKPASKARRSHTTIFEDHIDHESVQRRPSLSQQQAKRKAALQDVQNPATQQSQRSKRKVVDSDDEEEDELALEPPKEKDESEDAMQPEFGEELAEAPKKRGRGRPPKAANGSKSKAEEEISKVLNAQEPQEAIEIVDPPTKKKRGRPSKTSAPALEEDNLKTDRAHAERDRDNAQACDTTEAMAQPSTTKHTTPSGMQAPTPSPEKPSVTSVTTPQKVTKASPTLHSPLKSTSGVPLRVGLSKRQRIAPLLRMMRPPPKR